MTSIKTPTFQSSPSSSSPAVPSYIFRGHNSPIHALHFLSFSSNSLLASADSDGWIVVWSLVSRRAAAVWKGHEGGVLGLKDWWSGSERLISHGRDHKLQVWQINESALAMLDTKLPIDGATATSDKQPWLLHSMSVNALGFCAFATCYKSQQGPGRNGGSWLEEGTNGENVDSKERDMSILIVAPNGLDSGGIDFFELPSERRVSKLPSDKKVKTGMVMAASLFHHTSTQQLTVVSGYEDGHTMVHVRKSMFHPDDSWKWEQVHVSKPHSQPLLSLDVEPNHDFYFTSSADAGVAKFSLSAGHPSEAVSVELVKNINTKHAGQQGLRVRSDGKIFATAGWDNRTRVYSVKTLKELAVLKWHNEGCYAVAFANIQEPTGEVTSSTNALEVTRTDDNAVSALDVIKQQRSIKAQQTHWLAVGGKDAKISLWDIY